MGIKDVPGIIGRIEPKKDSGKLDKTKKEESGLGSNEVSVNPTDSVEITDAISAIEKENILASKASIEDFDHAKSLLNSILNGVDADNLLEIHGNADKIKTLLVM